MIRKHVLLVLLAIVQVGGLTSIILSFKTIAYEDARYCEVKIRYAVS